MKSRTGILKKPTAALSRLNVLRDAGKELGRVRVGLPSDSNPYPDGTSVIDVGAAHEFGSPGQGIPERSFLRSTAEEKRREYKRIYRRLSQKIVDGDITGTEALETLGLLFQTDVREAILEGIPPGLTSRSGTPLFDTGHLIESIVFQVDD